MYLHKKSARIISYFASTVLVVLALSCSNTRASRKEADFRPFDSVFTKVRDIAIAEVDPHSVLAFAKDSKGAIYVSDGRRKIITKFDSNGRLLNTVGEPGNRPGQFIVPWSIACDEYNNLYVLDIKTGRLNIFNEAGMFRNSFVVSLFGFAGVALKAGPKGNLFIGGVQPDKPGSPLLYKISDSGQLERSFFPRDSRVEKLHLHIVGGVDMGLDALGNIYAIQPISPKVSVFSVDGEFIRAFGQEPAFYQPPFKFPAKLPSEHKEIQALLAQWTELYDIHVLPKEQLVMLSYAVHSPVAYGLEIYGTDGKLRAGEIGSSAKPVFTDSNSHVYFFDQTEKSLVLREYSLKLP